MNEVVLPLVVGASLPAMLFVIILLPIWNWKFLRISFKERWETVAFMTIAVIPFFLLVWLYVPVNHRFFLFLLGDFLDFGVLTTVAIKAGALKFEGST